MIQVKKITLTPAQIIASFGAPIVILGAPAAGFIHNIAGVSLDMTFNTLAYTGSTVIGIRGISNSTIQILQDSTALASTVNRNVNFVWTNSHGVPWSTVKDIVLATSALVATGNSTIDFYIIYERTILP